jgi:hypothetical protein
VFAEGLNLKRFTSLHTAVTIASGLHPTNPVYYAELASWLFYSDGLAAGRVDLPTMVAAPWALNTPWGIGTLAANASGGMAAGDYLVTCTYANAAGEESGAPLAERVTVAAGGGIALTGIPQPTQIQATRIRFYVTSANGTELEFHSSVPVGTTSTALTQVQRGRKLETHLLEPMPAAKHLAIYNGRLYGTVDNYTIFSKPLRYGLYDPAEDFIMHESNPSMLATVSSGGINAGLFVAVGSRTYFLAGEDPKKFQQVVVYGSGAVDGSLTYVPGSAFDPELNLGTDLLPVWLATNGVICVGAPSGRVVPLTEGRYVAAMHERAAAIYREVNGIRQILMIGEGGDEQNLKSDDTEVAVSVTDALTE